MHMHVHVHDSYTYAYAYAYTSAYTPYQIAETLSHTGYPPQNVVALAILVLGGGTLVQSAIFVQLNKKVLPCPQGLFFEQKP